MKSVPYKKVSAAEQFRPHDFQTRVILLNGHVTPHILMAREAYLDMYYIAKNSGREEISWLGTVKQYENYYLIDEVILFEQEVGIATTVINPESIAQVATELIMSGETDKVNEIKFWGHVHPANSTYPSPQDENQMDVLANGNDWFIRGIFGREGRAEFTFFDWKNGVRFNDVPWSIFWPNDEGREVEILQQIKDKVTVEEVVQYKGYVSKTSPQTKVTENG